MLDTAATGWRLADCFLGGMMLAACSNRWGHQCGSTGLLVPYLHVPLLRVQWHNGDCDWTDWYISI